MHNIHELEKKWLYYKIKSYIPYIVISILSIILTITLFTFESTQINNTIIRKKEIIIEKPQVTKIPVVTTTLAPIKSQKIKDFTKKTPPREIQEQTNKIIILKPSLDFMKKLRSSTSNTFDIQTIPSQQNNTNIQTTHNKKIVQKKQKVIKDKSTKEKKRIIQISKRENKTDIQDVIKRFKINNNPALSLFIAKKYYRLGEYHKSYNYALITNKINSNIEASWIVFSKSLVKLKEKDMAIKTLKKYIKHSHSSNAQVLLDNIRAGKFK